MTKVQCAGHLLLYALVIYLVTLVSGRHLVHPQQVLGYVPRNLGGTNGVPLASCKAYYDDGFTQSGIYELDIPAPNGGQFEVFCDMDLRGGGYTVIQRRVDDTTPFDRGQAVYENGFGQPGGNYWLGLDKIRLILTHASQSELYIGMEKFPTSGDLYGDLEFAKYTSFTVTSRADGYKLNVGGYAPGSTTAVDALSCHDGQIFQSGWWIKSNSCSHSSELNGKYYNDGVTVPQGEGIKWGSTPSLKTVVMAIKPVPSST